MTPIFFAKREMAQEDRKNERERWVNPKPLARLKCLDKGGDELREKEDIIEIHS